MLPKIVLCVLIVWPLAGAGVESLYRSFQDPPRSYSLMPYWYWNGKITSAETRRLLKEMVKQGVHRAVVFPWEGMDVSYISEDYWSQVGAALNAARDLGFTLNFADEYLWPSGHAWDDRSDQPELSRVLQQHPEFHMTRLDYREHIVNGPQLCSFESSPAPELVVAAREDSSGHMDDGSFTVVPTQGNSVKWRAPGGRWVVTIYTRVPAVGGHNTRVDLLNPAAVKAYLGLVYEEYARRFPQHLGKTLQLTVADHEGAYGVPIAFTPRLWEEFEARKQYDLRRYLPLLSRHTPGGKLSSKVRGDYLDVVSELYVNSFNKQVTQWCSEHRLQHATSLFEEQISYQVAGAGDMFQQWRTGTAVFIDALLERARMPIDFKEAVSVAHFDRKPLLVENQGLQGHETYFSLEKARLGTNMCLLWGANTLVPYFDYDPAKIQVPPQWFTGQPAWRYFHHYADVVRRGQYMNAQGSHVAPVLLYYPRETAFANAGNMLSNKPRRGGWGNVMDHVQDFYSALQLELARAGWDYHILDSYYLERAEIRDATIGLADESFRVLILPPMTVMAGNAMRQVRRFIDSGGVVLAVGQIPEGLDAAGIRRFDVRHHPLFMDRLDYSRYIVVPDGIREDLRPVLDALRAVEPPQATWLGSDTGRLYFSHRRRKGVDWYWVVNDTDRERRVTLHVPGSGTFERWDAETGARRTISGPDLNLQFNPHDAFFIVRHDGAASAPVARPPEPEQVLVTLPNTGWRLTIESPKVLAPYARVEGQSEPVWLAPERLSNRDWWLIGPFPHDDNQGFFREYPPEHEFRPDAAYPGLSGDVRWRWCSSPTYTVTPHQLLNLQQNPRNGVYYAFAHVWSPEARRGKLRAAFGAGLVAWWNGERKLLAHRHTAFPLLRDSGAETRDIEVRKGWNTVLLKTEPGVWVSPIFMFRIIDESGATMRDLAYARERTLPPAPTQRVRLTVPAPPGAQDVTMEVDRTRIPERPIAFEPRPVGFVLQSWTDTGLAHYSGSALYETQFTVPPPAHGKQLVLDLGAVGVAAEVWVNGVKAGERAWRPFRFDITGLVRPGANALRVRVANSNAGWLAQGDNIYQKSGWGARYQTERDRLPTIRPNGLEGPVRILGGVGGRTAPSPKTETLMPRI